MHVRLQREEQRVFAEAVRRLHTIVLVAGRNAEQEIERHADLERLFDGLGVGEQQAHARLVDLLAAVGRVMKLEGEFRPGWYSPRDTWRQNARGQTRHIGTQRVEEGHFGRNALGAGRHVEEQKMVYDRLVAG